MKKTLYLILLGVTMVTSLGFVASAPLVGAAPQTASFGVSVGDSVVFREYRMDLGNITEMHITKANVTGVNSTAIDIALFEGNRSTGMWEFKETFVEDFSTNKVVRHRIVNASAISNLSELNNILIAEQLGQVLKEDKNLSANATFIASELISVWKIIANGTENGTGAIFKMEIAIDKTTGILIYTNDTIGNVSKIMEAMKYPGMTNPTGFGLNIGDEVVMYEERWEKWWDSEPEMEHPSHTFTVAKVVFLYQNPLTLENVAVVNLEHYFDPGLHDLKNKEYFSEAGRYITDDATTMYGDHAFQANLNFSVAIPVIENKMVQDMKLNASHTLTTGTNWFELKGNDTAGFKQEFYMELLPGVGLPKYRENIKIDPNDEVLFKERIMVVDGKGVVATYANLSVEEGDEFTILSQWDRENRGWGPENNWENHEKGVEIQKITISHIFGTKGNSYMVVGFMQKLEPGNPNPYHEDFRPLLIYDPDDPWGSIMRKDMNGPPFLFPTDFDFTDNTDEFLDFFSEMMGGGITPDTEITENTMLVGFRMPETEGNRFEFTLNFRKLDNGLINYMAMEQSEKWVDGNSGSERREKTIGYLLNSTVGSPSDCSKINPSDVFGVSPGQELVWARSRYNPNDSNGDPSKKSYNKIQVYQLMAGCDNFAIALGKRYYKNWDQTEFQQEMYIHNNIPASLPPEMVYWVVSGVRANDPTSWYMSEFYDKNVADFATVKPALLTLLNIIAPLPTDLVDSDITTNGRSFIATKVMGDQTFIIQFRVNEQGVMQDMITGTKWNNGTWMQWERTVLVSAPEGFAMGPTFENPPQYIEDTTSTNTGFDTLPFGVPGYPLGIFLTIAFAAVALKLRKKHM
jgi:hypothetical protein